VLSEVYLPAYKTPKNETLLQLTMFAVSMNLERRIADLKDDSLV